MPNDGVVMLLLVVRNNNSVEYQHGSGWSVLKGMEVRERGPVYPFDARQFKGGFTKPQIK
jgi:hypothetical protein